MFVSRDVIFDEKHFLFVESKEDNQLPNFPQDETDYFWQFDSVIDDD